MSTPELKTLAGLDVGARTNTLYRMYDKAGVLLYVGISSVVPSSRLEAHRKEKFWWGDVVGITLEHFPDREVLEAAEVVAIRSENPIYNVVDRTEPKPSLRKTPQRTILMDDDMWNAFGKLAKANGSGRAKLANEFIAWYTREPGAKLPRRPES